MTPSPATSTTPALTRTRTTLAKTATTPSPTTTTLSPTAPRTTQSPTEPMTTLSLNTPTTSTPGTSTLPGHLVDDASATPAVVDVVSARPRPAVAGRVCPFRTGSRPLMLVLYGLFFFHELPFVVRPDQHFFVSQDLLHLLLVLPVVVVDSISTSPRPAVVGGFCSTLEEVKVLPPLPVWVTASPVCLVWLSWFVPRAPCHRCH